jgi:hypothetical protein
MRSTACSTKIVTQKNAIGGIAGICGKSEKIVVAAVYPPVRGYIHRRQHAKGWP